MHAARQTAQQPELIRQFDEWVVAHWSRLFACAEGHADASTDVDLLLTDTLRRVAGIFCERQMDSELLLRYTMCCLRNAARRAHRRNQRRSVAESRFVEGRPPHEAPHRQAALRASLLTLLQQLPEPCGAIVRMRLWDELSFADIAAHLALGERRVRRYYDSALKMLRNKIPHE